MLSNEELFNLIINQKSPNKLLKAWTIKDLFINTLASMFTYTGLPDSVPQEFIERFFIMNGSVAMWRLDDANDEDFQQLIVSIGCDVERPNVYGVGRNYIASTLNGYVKKLKPGIEAAIGRNNSLYNSDMLFISQCTDLLTEMFTSLKTNILYSRLKPIFKVSSDKERAAVMEAFKNIKDDLEPIQVTSRNVLAEELGADETIKVLDITDVKNADKLQYIIKAIEDTLRFFYTYYGGQAIQGNGKLAQQTVDEVQGSTSVSFILPNDRLRMRRLWVEKCNELFGLDMTVDFSEAWKVESLKYKKESDIDENGELEELERTDEQTGEQTDEQTGEQTVNQPEKKEDEEA